MDRLKSINEIWVFFHHGEKYLLMSLYRVRYLKFKFQKNINYLASRQYRWYFRFRVEVFVGFRSKRPNAAQAK